MTRVLACLLLLFAVHQLSAQLYFKLEPLPGGLRYGVFVLPADGVSPTYNTVAGSGRISVALPEGAQLTDFASHAGNWEIEENIFGLLGISEMEKTNFLLTMDYPKIDFNSDAETLLFSFMINGNPNGKPCLPDSEAEMELDVIDFGFSPVVYYHYSGSYNSKGLVCSELSSQNSTAQNIR